MVNGLEITKQWVKTLFAIGLGAAFVLVFNSWFLAIMTWTFLFFIPSGDRDIERSFSSAIFTWGMGVLLLLAFFQSELLGLGLVLLGLHLARLIWRRAPCWGHGPGAAPLSLTSCSRMP